MKGLDIGFPLNTCGNDSFMLTLSVSVRDISY